MEAVQKLGGIYIYNYNRHCLGMLKLLLCLGCPKHIGIDRGSENSKVAECQIANMMIYSTDSEAEKSVRYVKSPNNSVFNTSYT